MEYNPDALDRELGSTDTDTLTPEPSEILLSDSDRAALKVVAAQSTPGVITPGSEAVADSIPDYLKADLESAIVPINTDFTEPYKNTFGAGALKEGETADADKFFADVTALTETENHLNTIPSYREYAAFAAQTYEGESGAELKAQDDLMLVQGAVRSALADNYTDAEYDRIMAQLQTEDGALNKDGITRANKARNDISNWLKTTESDARNRGKEKAEATLSWRKEFAASLEGAKVLGVDLEADDAPVIRDFVLSGEMDNVLANMSKTDIQAIATYFIPSLRAKYFGLKHYERGASDGSKTRLAARLN